MAVCQGNGENEKNVFPELQLQPYKENAKANLAVYVEALEPGDYSDENRAAIEDTTVLQGDDFIVDASLKNQSGEKV